MTESEQLDEIFEYYKREGNSQETLVALMREVQQIEGYISETVLQRMTEEFQIKPSVLSLILKMYPSLKKSPYEHEIICCTGARCSSKQGMELLEEVKKYFSIGSDGVSADGKVCLRTRNCLKQCKTSPNMMIDGRLYSNIPQGGFGKVWENAVKSSENQAAGSHTEKRLPMP